MEARELRIGNWVQHRDRQIKVEIVDLDSAYQLEPIPLTPGILEKAWFDYHANTNTHFKKCGIFILSWDGDTFLIYDPDFGRGGGIVLSSEASKYVHQLQNLYWCLVGEELNIDL